MTKLLSNLGHYDAPPNLHDDHPYHSHNQPPYKDDNGHLCEPNFFPCNYPDHHSDYLTILVVLLPSWFLISMLTFLASPLNILVTTILPILAITFLVTILTI